MLQIVKFVLIMTSIRKAGIQDTDTIMEILDSGRQIMRSSGNTRQWAEGYPTRAMVEADIAAEEGYILEDENGRSLAYFAFKQGPDPTYSYIYEGDWVDKETPYHVLHRLSKRLDAKGVFHRVIQFCLDESKSLRIDTHEDNIIMLKSLRGYGFEYCGKIICSDGTERVAFQRKGNKTV